MIHLLFSLTRILCGKVTLVFVLLLFFSPVNSIATGLKLSKHTLQINGLERVFFLYQPANVSSKASLPLVFLFHGGGGKARQIARFSGFTTLAEKYGALAVFPQGIKGHWYDERLLSSESKPDPQIDDVAFFRAIIKEISSDFPVNRKKVFATGISNGGVFTQQLAVQASAQLRAIATITAQLPESIHFDPVAPVSVMMINGTDDPLMPYSGGDLVVTLSPKKRKQGKVKTRGRVLSTDKTVKLWLNHNGLSEKSQIETIIDRDAADGTIVTRTVWQQLGNASSVALYKVQGGGHTWPGRKGFLPEKILGKVSQEIDASKVIWEFFSSLK